MKRAVAVIALALFPSAAMAWGPLGHRIVAETAAILVEDDLPGSWGAVLARHRFQLGVYAFVPDALFRHIDGANGKVEGPTHFLDLDASGQVAGRGGTVPWRVAQFLGRARDDLREVRRIPGGYQTGAAATGDANRIFAGLFDLGVMSHYSGDAAMPYHATVDWNGYAHGEGGIHFYFEDDCVSALEPGLAKDVLAAARKHRARWLASWGARGDRPVELIVGLLRDSAAAVASVAAADKRYAVIKLAAPGSERTAERRPAPAACPSMKPLLVERLAKGAAVTAELWKRALPEGVDASAAGGFQLSDMELDPAYVPPDYGAPSLPVGISATGASEPSVRRRK